jgi:DNA (cytosine-5)-methyltransferase 1
MAAFEATGYLLSFDAICPGASVLNAADFGAPQKRRRFILIGAREGAVPSLPTPTHDAPRSLEVSSGIRKPWVTFREAVEGLSDPCPEHLDFPSSWGHLLVLVPPGGCWRDLPTDLHQDALGGAYDVEGSGLKGGRTGFLRRISWDEPAPTVVDRPNTRASCLCHPEHIRPLSVKEYARLQGFPDDWVFKGPLTARYELIGQATPVPLATAVAVAVRNAVGTPTAAAITP